MTLLIGIDDTDNKESRGTGFKSRQLASRLVEHKLGAVMGITRHQLYVHEDIAYTSQNSSACLLVETDKEKQVSEFCINYLKEAAEQGSDAGLCICNQEFVGHKIMEWGTRAKREVLKLEEALQIAQNDNIFLRGYTGSFIGQIGALAAVGLRKRGNDGRFIWLKGTGELRDFDSGIYRSDELKEATGIARIETPEGEEIPDWEKIYCDGWTRPILFNNRAVLLVEKTNFADYGWKTCSKEYIRRIS